MKSSDNLKFLIFNPALKNNTGECSPNVGDAIIWEAIEKQLLERLASPPIITSISSHTAPSQNEAALIRGAAYRLVGGSNLLQSDMWDDRQWKISGRLMSFRHRAILMGVGWRRYEANPRFKSKVFLKSVLSNSGLHSVRDNYTLEKLKSIGVNNVINTSCPTLWELAGKEQIVNNQKPTGKVLVMLTDYRKNYDIDGKLIDILDNHYEEIVFWPQGAGDAFYGSFLLFKCRKKVRILENNLEALESFLAKDGPIDCITTRLHGGIKALKAGCRTLILRMDNRATEISKETGLPSVDRDDFEYIQKWAEETIPAKMFIDKRPINKWFSQFTK